MELELDEDTLGLLGRVLVAVAVVAALVAPLLVRVLVALRAFVCVWLEGSSASPLPAVAEGPDGL